MIIKYKCNLVCGIGALLASAALFLIIPWQIQVETVVNFGITSRSLPYGIAVLIGLCGMALVIQSLVLKQDKEKILDLSAEFPPALLFVAFILYILSFEKDWMVSTALLACVTLALSKCKNWLYYVIAVVLTIGMYFLFANILHIRLRSILF